ncbi:MAG: hypothetical protein PHS66_05985 [Candidatus Omnitrophica bacterium]|nr:hypothetical protein [Candidatus Omnitrophota bacterium]
MHKYLFFLKCSSVVIKVAAWIFLFFGLVGSISLFSGKLPDNPRWMGFLTLAFYLFIFFFFFLVAKMADILSGIIKTERKD